MLRREDGHVFRRALELQLEGKRKKEKKTLKKQVDEESMKADLSGEDVY